MRLQTKYNAFIVARNLKKYNITCVPYDVNYIDVDKSVYDYNKLKPFVTYNEFSYICTSYKYYVFVFMPYCIFIDEYLKYNKYGEMQYINTTMSLIIFQAYDYNVSVSVIMCHIYDMYEYIKHLYKTVYNKRLSVSVIYTISKHYVYKKTNMKLYDILRHLFVYKKLHIYNLVQDYYNYNCIMNICAAKKYNIDIKGATDVSDSKKYVDKIIESLNVYNKYKIIKYIVHAQKVYNVNIDNTIIHVRILRKLQHIPLNNLNLCQSLNLLANIMYVNDEVIALIKRINKLFKKSLHKRNCSKHFSDYCIQNLNKINTFNIYNIQEIIQIFNYVLDNYYIIDLHDEDVNLLVSVYNKFNDILVS